MQAPHIEWQVLSFAELNTYDLYAILQLRSEVFVCEQVCHYQDCDNVDLNALHVLGKQGDKLIAYSRIIPPTSANEAVHFGRVAVAKTARGHGLGQALIRQVMQAIDCHYPDHDVEISAQHYLIDFYRAFGFEVVGEPYDDVGILHIKMLAPAPCGVL